MLFKTSTVNQYEFIKEGKGQPLVLFHGLMGGLSNFDSLISFFSKNGFTVFAPKLPIFGFEVKDTKVETIAKFAINFLKDIVKKPASILGNSLGGHIGLIVSHNQPKLVKSLILTGSSGLFERSFGESFPKRGNYYYVKKKTQDVFYDPKIATNEIIDEVYETVNNRDKAIKTLYIARSAMKHNMKKEVGKIELPVCLIWGKQDNVTPPEVALEFNKLLKNSELYWIDKCGHAPMMEHPDEFNESLSTWFRKVGVTKAK